MVVDYKFFQKGFFDELDQIVASCHLIDINNSLDEVISVSIIALQPQKFTDRIQTVDMLWVQLGELEKSINIV